MYDNAIKRYSDIGKGMLPQPDVEYINTTLSHNGKKSLDPFKMNRLNKAIQRLESYSVVQGIAARADYYIFINNPNEALEITRKAINYYGYDMNIVRSMSRAAVNTGRWNLLKPVLEEVLTVDNLELEEGFIDTYIKYSYLYLDNSGDFKKILIRHNVKEYNELFDTINERKSQLIEKDCDLEVYREVLSRTFQAIHQKYSLAFSTEFRIDNLQLIVSDSYWSLEDALELTEDINNRILENPDLDFQIEADELEVFCINFPITNVPQDFVYYDDDDDSELIDLVKARKKDNAKPELEGEVLYVEA